MPSAVLYTVDQGSPAFETARATVDIVCLGDSLTGWNNFGPARTWPYPTYPQFLQELCLPLDLRIANGGIAGEVSDNGPQQVRDYLALFPNARYFVFGMGTNDLGTSHDTEETSNSIIDNLFAMVKAVRNGKQTVLFNVPNVNEAMFPPDDAKELREKRDYHNAHLKAFLRRDASPLSRHLLPPPRRAFCRRIASERRRCEDNRRGGLQGAGPDAQGMAAEHGEMKRVVKRTVGIAAIYGLLAYGAVALAQEQVVVKPEETDEILANPGIGWETFHQTSKQDKNLPSWIPSTIHYARWGWGELEPQPGKLNTEFWTRY